ncbi:tolB protein precursor, periplasmic protein involved in the tonb-independent uptake of group A colicins [hydrothermal vent metagenome]|uniref:TolB protein, periplasmic protein involved in the tonb-independent uptake of group A colicins n=1 Tax=hydrothermal vent metagenome TaxID=652676 RepID=A0A1W1CX44_9ZZZZ
MKIIFSLFIFISVVFANDATIEVIKKANTLPSIAIEDASISYDDTFRIRFFKTLVADLNVISIFNVDRHHRIANFNDVDVLFQNKDMNYVLRYKMFEDDNAALNVQIKLLEKNNEVFVKNYRVARRDIFMFISHAIAYDINEYMGKTPVTWMKRKVIFSRIVAPKKSEIVIADYTLAYQHVILKGGFNIFPKWANKEQTAFYYTTLNTLKPTLKYVDIKTGKVKNIISSEGMMVCSDVSADCKTLLLTMTTSGQPDIYSFNTVTKKYKRLTRYSGIDVNGQFMNKNQIVFISSRLGYPNVFTKHLDTDEVEQMVYYGRSNVSCSAHGNYVVYAARESSNAFSKNTFNLHLISTKSDFIRRLTATGINQFPKFSKDGDAIIFIKNYKGQSAIGIIRLSYNKNYLFPLKYGRIQSMDW